nr:MAG TPA: hypothetical protein [Caudoviricetes sp.]
MIYQHPRLLSVTIPLTIHGFKPKADLYIVEIKLSVKNKLLLLANIKVKE